MTHINLLVDLTNVARMKRHTLKTFKKRPNMQNDFVDSLIAQRTIEDILIVSNKVRASSIVLVEDSRDLWRKDIYPDYKNKETKEDEYKNEIYSAMEMTVDLFKNHTKAGHLKVPRCEADDIFGYWCRNCTPGVKNVIMTSDKDMMQLIDKDTRVYNPLIKNRGYRELDDYGAGFFLFEKCIRGDANDNIPSAFPRVQRTRLIKAWEDETNYELQNLMEHKLGSGEKVGELFEFNRSLIDLSAVPDVYQQDIQTAINKMTYGSFNMTSFMMALTQMGINKLLDTVTGTTGALIKSPRF